MRSGMGPGARWLRRIGVVALALSVAAIGARTAWHLAGETSLGAVTVSAPVPAVAPPEVDLAPVLAFAPFGTRAAPPPEAPAAAMPDLDLRLYGVIRDPARGASRALIGHDGQTLSYQVGDTIAEAAVLAEVRDTAVVLNIGGTTRVLDFTSFQVAAGVPDDGPDPLDRLGAALVLDPRPPLVPEPEDARPQTTEELIAFWRERIRRNPQQVLGAVGFVQVEDGYRVAAEHDRGVALAGLLEGDVVKSVNGRTIGNIVADRNLFDDVVTSGVARVEIEREGRVISMSFPIQ